MSARALLGLAVILSGLLAQPAAAQTRKPTVQEVAAIRNCATKYHDDVDEGERQCLFSLVATPCTNTREGSSNIGTADCYRVEWVIWDNLLNENFDGRAGQPADCKITHDAASLDRLPRHDLQFLHGQDSGLDGDSDGSGLCGA